MVPTGQTGPNTFGPEFPEKIIGHGFARGSVINSAFAPFLNEGVIYQVALTNYLANPTAENFNTTEMAKTEFNTALDAVKEQLALHLFDILHFNDENTSDPLDPYEKREDGIIVSYMSAPRDIGSSLKGSVIGGTGKYRKVRGDVDITPLAFPNISGGGSLRFTFNLH